MEPENVSAESIKGLGLHLLASQRISVLLLISIWLWVWILKILSSNQLDVSAVLQFRKPNELKLPLTNLQLQRSSRKFAVKVSKIIVPLLSISLVVQPWVDQDKMTLLYLLIKIMPLLQFSIIITLILKDCEIIKYCAKRILLIEPTPKPLRNAYILLSDSLTSFAKPLIDFTLYLTSFFLSKDTLWTHFDLLISLMPLLIRVWQCLREYYLTRDKSLLFNALKYCSSVPIIICIWYSRVEPNRYDHNIHGWIMLVNSCYTLIWDVKMDWKLDSIVNIRSNGKFSSSSLRAMFPKILYYIGCLFDFIIKFWWIWTINGNRHMVFFESELQYLEILRRCNWVVFKLEAEYVTMQNVVTQR